MKRLNPATNQPFKRGDTREDGRLFKCYNKTRLRNDGFFQENWITAESMERNIACVKVGQKLWYNRNAEHVKQKARAHELANPEKTRAKKAKWKKNNREIENFHLAKRRAAKLQRTPKWLTQTHHEQIQQLYTQAKQLEQQTGIKYHVDHIVPLVNPRVSGLHVPWNLQLLTETENTKKSNKFNI